MVMVPFMVLMAVMTAAALVIMAVVMVGVGLLPGGVIHPDARQKLLLQGGLFDGGQDGLAVQLVPGGGEDDRRGVLFPQQGHRPLQLVLGQVLGAGEEDRPRMLHLVVVELAEILHIHLHLGRVRHGDKAVELQRRVLPRGLLHRRHHVGQLAHPGGFDEDAVRVEALLHLVEGLAEVPHQGAADAAGGHLGNLDARVLQEAAVHADLAKLVLNKHQLFALVRLRKQLFDEGGLTRPQEPGHNVDFCHWEIISFT